MNVLEIARQAKADPDNTEFAPDLLFKLVQSDAGAKMVHVVSNTKHGCSASWIAHTSGPQRYISP
jgi:hypothetical protein